MMNMWLRIRTFAAPVKQSAIKSLSVKPVQKSKSLNLLNRSIKNRQIRALKSPERFVSNSTVYSICKSTNNRIQTQNHTEVRARGVQRFVSRTRPEGDRRRVRRRPHWFDRTADRALSPPPSTAPRTPAGKWNTTVHGCIVHTCTHYKYIVPTLVENWVPTSRKHLLV